MNNRREFLKFSAGIVPAMALGLPLLYSAPIRKNSKVFCLDSGGDTSYIIAESPERVKHWWFTELGGEKIPDDAEVTEISPDTIISQGIEDLEDISEEDQKNYLYYRVAHINDLNYGKEPSWQWNYEHWHDKCEKTPAQLAYDFRNMKNVSIRFCIKKPAKLFLKDTIENQYPIPCCFC